MSERRLVSGIATIGYISATEKNHLELCRSRHFPDSHRLVDLDAHAADDHREGVLVDARGRAVEGLTLDEELELNLRGHCLARRLSCGLGVDAFN